MNRNDIVNYTLGNSGLGRELPRKKVREALDFMITEITAELLDGKPVKLTGFGTFEARTRKDRMGRNPKTGEALMIKTHRAIVVRPTRNFLEKG